MSEKRSFDRTSRARPVATSRAVRPTLLGIVHNAPFKRRSPTISEKPSNAATFWKNQDFSRERKFYHEEPLNQFLPLLHWDQCFEYLGIQLQCLSILENKLRIGVFFLKFENLEIRGNLPSLEMFKSKLVFSLSKYCTSARFEWLMEVNNLSAIHHVLMSNAELEKFRRKKLRKRVTNHIPAFEFLSR